MNELRVVVDPYPKSHQHLKIVLNPDGTLVKVHIYSDEKGNSRETLYALEVLKEEIVKFGKRTSEIMAYQLITDIRTGKRKFDSDCTEEELIEELCGVFENE